MTVLEQLTGYQVLEPMAGILDRRPIPKVELFLFFDSPDAQSTEGRDAKTKIQSLKDGDPAIRRFMGYAEVKTEPFHGKRCANAPRQLFGQ
jgi:hypothetical protein